jgi:signal transduction histidine kinase
MKNGILSVQLKNELDIVLSYKRARQLGEFTGMALPVQTKFATAVSEICRNVLEHVGEGNIYFSIIDKENDLFLEAIVIDFGKGIYNLENVLSKVPHSSYIKGWGIFNARKLVDFFTIDTSETRGTKVTIQKRLPARRPLINNKLIGEWKNYFSKEVGVSPYEEIKGQNLQLIEMMETLRLKNLEVENQMKEIIRLNYNLDQFAYTISHDLKAPLKNMEGLVSALRETTNEKDQADSAELWLMMEGQLTRMDKMIYEILSYSSKGKQTLERNEIDLSDLIREVILTLTVPTNISIHISSDMPVIMAEEILLKQIFSNLINNSIKYQDKSEGFVKIGLDKLKGENVYFVEDDGPGIPKKSQEKIFRLFEALSMKSKENTGIGLSIVKTIIDEKGGTIWVESEGRGSKFRFTWPDSSL